jgi:hypothetical protein
MRSRIVRWLLALCLLPAFTAVAPAPARAAASPCDGTHAEGWTALGSAEDLFRDDVKYASNATSVTIKAGALDMSGGMARLLELAGSRAVLVRTVGDKK